MELKKHNLEGKRTTVILDPEDQDHLKRIAHRERCSDMEAIRKSIRFTNRLLELIDDGGEIFIEKDGHYTTVVVI